MRSGDHLGDAKCRKGHLVPSNLTLLLLVINRNGFRRMKEEGQILNVDSDLLIFAYGLSYDLSKFSDDFCCVNSAKTLCCELTCRLCYLVPNLVQFPTPEKSMSI